jgi:hypothetical protein
MKINTKLLVAASFLLFTAMPAMAGPWGALATSPNADYGWAKNYDTEGEAERAALRQCRKYSGRCTVKKTFRDMCISVASSTNGAMGWAWGYGRSEGNRRAMDECRNQGGRSCRLVERFCSGDADEE